MTREVYNSAGWGCAQHSIGIRTLTLEARNGNENNGDKDMEAKRNTRKAPNNHGQ